MLNTGHIIGCWHHTEVGFVEEGLQHAPFMHGVRSLIKQMEGHVINQLTSTERQHPKTRSALKQHHFQKITLQHHKHFIRPKNALLK
jgi:hypothetical protein